MDQLELPQPDLPTATPTAWWLAGGCASQVDRRESDRICTCIPTPQGAPKGCLPGLNVDHAVPDVTSARERGDGVGSIRWDCHTPGTLNHDPATRAADYVNPRVSAGVQAGSLHSRVDPTDGSVHRVQVTGTHP